MSPRLHLLAHLFRRQVLLAGGGIRLVDRRQHFRTGRVIQLLDSVKNDFPLFRLELGKFFEDFDDAHKFSLDSFLDRSKPVEGSASVDFRQNQMLP
jgi:hypothetical protein